MRKLPYYVVDVFGRGGRLTGNQLAVVDEASDLSSDQMQAIAREYNLSETTFIQEPTRKGCVAYVRIFTPRRELPFAGHPTLGTAFVLSSVLKHGDNIVLQEKIGDVPVSIVSDGMLTLTAAKLPWQDELKIDKGDMMEAFGIVPFEVENIQAWSSGPAFVIIQVKLSTLESLKPDIAKLESSTEQRFSYIIAKQGSIWRARMFAPSVAVMEDPATGSAATALGGWFHANGYTQEGTNHYVVHQGEEMLRPSELLLDVLVEKGVVTEVKVSGKVILVMEGSLYLED